MKKNIVKRKAEKLFKRIIIIVGALTGVWSIINVLLGIYLAALVDAIFFISMVCAYWLFKKGLAIHAKVFSSVTLFLGLIVFTSVYPKEVGLYLFFFIFTIFTQCIFSSDEKSFRTFFLFLPVITMFFLLLTGNLFIPSIDIPIDDVEKVFLNNIAGFSILFVFFIHHFTVINEGAEVRLKFLLKELEQKNKTLEKVNKQLDRFLYSASHDLKAPLTSLKGLVNIARYDTKDEVAQYYFNLMDERMIVLDQLIHDIIDFRSDARDEAKPEVVSIEALVDKIYLSLQYLKGHDKILFIKDIRIQQEIKIHFKKLSLILMNLLSNAIKYHDLSKSNPWIKVEVFLSGNSLQVTITDNGQGIAVEHHSNIFDMFYRATKNESGSGLGLFIVKEALESIGGKINVTSNFNEGSCFSVTIPLSSNRKIETHNEYLPTAV